MSAAEVIDLDAGPDAHASGQLPMIPVSSNDQAYPACIKTGVLNKQANVIGHTVVLSACLAKVRRKEKASHQSLRGPALLTCQAS